MKIITKFDKVLLVLGFLIVVGIFTLAFVLYFKGGMCVTNPYEYMLKNNISFPNPYQIRLP